MQGMWIEVIPLVLGILVLIALDWLDRTRYPVRGISPSYFASVALLFGLFASLAATEAWQRTNKTSAALATEVSDLRALLRIAETLKVEGTQIRHAVNSYVADVRTNELGNSVRGAAGPPPKALQQLYLIGASGTAFNNNSSLNTSYLQSLESLRMARVQRLELAHSRIPTRHFAILMLMGLLTQIAIGFSHSGNRTALVYSVMLFSVAFGAAVHFIQAFDDPYSGGLNGSIMELSEVS